MHFAPPSPYLAPFDGSFRIAAAPTEPAGKISKKRCEERLAENVARIDRLQRLFYAQDQYSLLLIFQAMDAAGKDGTIRATLSGVDPAGCQVYSFKAPSTEELDHDFLWRTASRLPERGRIGVFNRSWYEEVLVVRVHPAYLIRQRIPGVSNLAPNELGAVWTGRYTSIRDHERHLSRNGTVILKFFLNVSREEQRKRLLDRLNEPDRHWKFEAQDIAERHLWDDYMHAYERTLQETSTPWAPWYAVPADNKPYLRMVVSELIADTLSAIDPQPPEVSEEERAGFNRLREALESER